MEIESLRIESSYEKTKCESGAGEAIVEVAGASSTRKPFKGVNLRPANKTHLSDYPNQHPMHSNQFTVLLGKWLVSKRWMYPFSEHIFGI